MAADDGITEKNETSALNDYRSEFDNQMQEKLQDPQTA